MSNNEELKTGLMPFWKKALPWLIVGAIGYALGFVTGVVL